MLTFDEWRALYDSMTYEQQVAFHNETEKHWPDQFHYNYGNVRVVLEAAKNIVEIGAWKGNLAYQGLSEFPIEKWTAIEICTDAINKTVCSDPRFSYIIPEEFDWFKNPRDKDYDTCIATHFIEHISGEHFDQLVNWIKGIKIVFFESPLTAQGENWEGYFGTHKLEYGWAQVTQRMIEAGYEVTHELHNTRIYKLK